MRILYGVVGEGMGHATRSRVVIEHLLGRGHRVRVVVSGRAFRFLRDAFADREGFAATEIAGLTLSYRENAVSAGATLRDTLAAAPAGLRHNYGVYRDLLGGERPDAVFSDFESFAYLYGRRLRVPVVSIDNLQIIDRCRHEPEVTRGGGLDFRLARAFVRARLPRAYHYLVTSFFFPPVRKPRTTLLPPILRPEILAARREPGNHVLVYQTAATNSALVPALRTLPHEFRVYGMGREGVEGNVRLCAFSERGFVDDLRTARAAVAGGGHSFLAEAVHLRVPVLSIPLEGQAEQQLNARYLARLGYGERAERADAAAVQGFLTRLPAHERALAGYTPQDDSRLHACVDELLDRIGRGEPPPVTLAAGG